MKTHDIARRLSAVAARRGTRAAISFTLQELTDEERAILWHEFGATILRTLLRKYRPNLELVRSVKSVLAVAVPVGNSGNRSAIHDLRARDLQRIAQFRERMGLTMLGQSKTLLRVATFIGDRTVGECLDIIPRRDLNALVAIFRIAPLVAEAA